MPKVIGRIMGVLKLLIGGCPQINCCGCPQIAFKSANRCLSSNKLWIVGALKSVPVLEQAQIVYARNLGHRRLLWLNGGCPQTNPRTNGPRSVGVPNWGIPGMVCVPIGRELWIVGVLKSVQISACPRTSSRTSCSWLLLGF